MDDEGQDMVDASQALIAWLRSQNMAPGVALQVLTLTIACLIHIIAHDKGLDELEGGRAVSRGLLRALETFSDWGLDLQ